MGFYFSSIITANTLQIRQYVMDLNTEKLKSFGLSIKIDKYVYISRILTIP